MAAILDFSKFTFTAEQIRAVQDLIYDDVISSPEIEMIMTFYPGIVYDKEIGFIGEGGLVGVAHQGCDPQPQDWNISTRKVKWTPKKWEILIHQCSDELESTAAIYSLKTKTRIDDFVDIDYMNIVQQVLSIAIKEFAIRLFFFSDENAANVADGGQITDGVPVKYFTLIDGFFKQFITQVTANASQRVTISENSGVSYSAQKLMPSNVRDIYLPALVDNADDRLSQITGTAIYCTNSFYKAYKASLRGTDLKELLYNMTNGVQSLTYDGVPLIPMPIFDKIIKKYYNTGSKLINPHRAWYTTKELLAGGVDDLGSFGDLRVWYNEDSRKVKMESMGRADAKILNPELFQFAY